MAPIGSLLGGRSFTEAEEQQWEAVEGKEWTLLADMQQVLCN